MTRHTGYISLISKLYLGRMAESSKGVTADDDRSLETLWGAQLTSLGELRNYLQTYANYPWIHSVNSNCFGRGFRVHIITGMMVRPPYQSIDEAWHTTGQTEEFCCRSTTQQIPKMKWLCSIQWMQLI